jgi:hypothetical protein
LAAGALTAGLFALGAGTAVAASWHNIPTLDTGGAEFANGQYKLWPSGQQDGAFEWHGDLTDTDDNDGHNVYVQVKVEGFDWNRYNGKQKQTVHLSNRNWAPSEQYVEHAEIRVCRDKGSFNPDNCGAIQKYNR